ncbi:haloacid dehalogenase [Sulfurovum lithotrophicum]|uniref:Haloacid dehalogenase n=1 Tax=Sulfurovum lithotrophicum TaxID=206403 RepID=A0A7U4M077_9BACT|nr:HAD family hydrolase [Sulfurovum lithotrophicum]AKF24458.1 haloacid dehalogenase [Sulfurovum lithotrophicum]
MIEIPNYKTLNIIHIVCDYNGTIAKDGMVHPEVKVLFKTLAQSYTLHVITADTFGSVAAQLADSPVTIKVLSGSDHTQEKADFIDKLGAESCAALGNGNNDAAMLQTATLGIAIFGEEGCAKDTLIASDIVCKDVTDALSLFLHPKRLIATLRK